MKILFILEYYPPYKGGAERHFSLLAAELVRKGVEVLVLTANYDEFPNSDVIDGVCVQRINVRNRLLFSILAIRSAVQLASSYDIIHTTTYNAALPAKLASLIKNRPIIITVHEYWGGLWWRLPFLRIHERLVYWIYEFLILSFSYDRTVAVSKFTRKKIENSFPNKTVAMIYNGLPKIETKIDFHPSNYFLFVGRLGVSKGIDLLSLAIKTIAQKNHNISFKLATPNGQGRIYKYLKSELRNELKSQQVEIIHDLTDAALFELMRSARAVIVPSYSEGFGFVAAEAAQIGTPIISSGKGALKEIVSGRFVEMNALSSTDLVTCLMNVWENRFKEAPRLEFAIEATVSSHLKLYGEIIHARKSAPLIR